MAGPGLVQVVVAITLAHHAVRIWPRTVQMSHCAAQMSHCAACRARNSASRASSDVMACSGDGRSLARWLVLYWRPQATFPPLWGHGHHPQVADDEEASAVLDVVAGTGGEGLAGADVP